MNVYSLGYFSWNYFVLSYDYAYQSIYFFFLHGVIAKNSLSYIYFSNEKQVYIHGKTIQGSLKK